MAAIHHNTLKKAKSHQIELTVEDGEVVASQNGVRLASHLSGTVALQAALNRLGGDHVQEIKADERAGIPKAQWSANSTPASRKAFVKAYDAAGSQEAQDFLHEDNFVKAPKAAKPNDHKAWEPKAAKPAKAPKAKRPAKSSGAHEDAARLEGWKPVKGGGFRQEGVEDKKGGVSEAATWRDLCDEQDIEVESEGRSIVKAKYRQLYRPNKNSNGDDLSQQLREYLTTENEDGVECIDADKLVRFAKANDCWIESYASLRTGTGAVNVGQQRMNVGNRLRGKVRKDPEYAIKWPK